MNKLHHNKIVFLDRIKLNILFATMKADDSRYDTASKVLKRALDIERKKNAPCMKVPVRVYELRKLFPENLEGTY